MTREEARTIIHCDLLEATAELACLEPADVEEIRIVKRYIEALEVAEEALQERPKGRGHTLHETKLTKIVECTHCNTPFRYQKKGNIIVDDFYYCPNCGRPMERS